MKKLLVAAVIVASISGLEAKAFDLGSLLGNAGDAVTGVVEGLLTQSDISVEQMAGTWTAMGSAVAFQSDNALKKAGGAAVAGTIESKLDPYYQKYGLTGSTLTVQSDGNFTLKVKGISLKGKITKREDGNFNFAFTPFGSFKIGSITAYVEKPLNGLNVMFDASKLMSLISSIAKLTGNSLANTAADLLGSYDGLLVGFEYKGSGASPTTNSTTSPSSNDSTGSNKLTDTLKGLFGK